MSTKKPMRVLLDELGNPTGLAEFQVGETIDPAYLPAASGGGEPIIVAGTAADYWRGDKTWHNFGADVRSAAATGLVTTDSGNASATDTIIVVLGKYQAQLSLKVDKVAGMGLSSNDFTSTLLTKLNGIATGATANATDAALRDRTTHTGTQLISTVTNLQATLDTKVDKITGMGLSSSDFTAAEKAKLGGLDPNHYRGTFSTLAALQAAVPTANAGDYANVDPASGTAVIQYLWDVNDTVWTYNGPTAAPTAAQIKSLYESNPDTNAYTGAEKTKLGGIAAGATANTDTSSLTEGANLYFTVARVLTSALDTLTLTNAAIVVGDSVRVMFGKVQAQLNLVMAKPGSQYYWNGNQQFADFASSVRQSVMTGVSFTATTAMLATDTALAAFGKLQGQISLRALAGSNSDITSMSALATLTSARLTGNLLSMEGYIDKTVVNATATGTVTLDCSFGSIFDLTLIGNTTLAFSNVPTLSGESFSVVVKVRQGTTAYTLTQPSGVTPITSGGVTPPTPGASKRADYVYSTTNGTAWDWYAGAAT